jgi:hypothetical protein
MMQAASGTVLNIGGLHTSLMQVIIIGVLAVAGIALIHAFKRNVPAVLSILAVVLVASLVVGISSGNAFQRIGGELAKLIFRF